MKKIDVLIIRDKDDYDFRLANSIAKMLSSLGRESDFSYADDYDLALEKIGIFGYEIICSHSHALVPQEFLQTLFYYSIKYNNKNLANFFISFQGWEVERIKESGFALNFLKDEDQIISPSDISKVRQAILNTGKISYQIKHDFLIKPVAIFSRTYADSTLSETEAKQLCDSVARYLNMNQVHYSVFDHDFYVEVSVGEANLDKVKIVSATSDSIFWKNWVKQFL